jgi:molybdopterin/thiamine biosynthesis adenylyltransferase
MSQDITRAAVGRPKAIVQGERLQRINPALAVVALVERVESVPLVHFRNTVVVTGLDTRVSRVGVNRIVSRVHVPWIDTGVHADGLLARVSVYLPDPTQPCLECAWTDGDYASMEQPYACVGAAAPVGATSAPAALGALAASLAALELQKLLAGQWEQVAAGRQVLVDAAWHRHFVTTYRRNPECRFDHASWTVSSLDVDPRACTLAQLWALAGVGPSDLGLEGQVFVRQLTCPACGAVRLCGCRLAGRLTTSSACDACGRRMLVAAPDVSEWLRADDLAPAVRDRRLVEFGVRPGDVVTLRCGGEEQHVQLGEPRAAAEGGATAATARR